MPRKMFDFAVTKQGTIGNGVADRAAGEQIIKHGKGTTTINDFAAFRPSSNLNGLLTTLGEAGMKQSDLDSLTPNDLVFAERVRRANGVPR